MFTFCVISKFSQKASTINAVPASLLRNPGGHLFTAKSSSIETSLGGKAVIYTRVKEECQRCTEPKGNDEVRLGLLQSEGDRHSSGPRSRLHQRPRPTTTRQVGVVVLSMLLLDEAVSTRNLNIMKKTNLILVVTMPPL